MQMSDEFSEMFPDHIHLRDSWPAVKDKLLEFCSTKHRENQEIRNALNSLSDDFNEG
jgi:hypothetical protein